MDGRSARRRSRLGRAAARRIALAAQGFGGERPRDAVTMRQLTGTIDRIGLAQIDSVNVLVRAHLMPFYSRLGPYDPSLLDRAMAEPPRRLVEYWAHEASLIPPATHRLLRWRMGRADQDVWRTVRAAASQPELLASLVGEVERNGPATAAEIGSRIDPDHIPDRSGWGWNWPPVKSGLEYLFFAGHLTSAGRTPQFERRYELPERVIPTAIHEAPDPPLGEAIEDLVEIAARAHGVATGRCLRDYFRLPAAETRAAIGRLVSNGKLIPVEVEGPAGPAWIHADARRPRKIEGRALLAPFDPLVFERRRLEDLFEFRYRIEIYTPKAKRRHGYYVLPFLLNEAIVARVDLKADRARSLLLVQSAWAESTAPPETAAELAAELELLAGWLGLAGISVAPRGDLAPKLARRVG